MSVELLRQNIPCSLKGQKRFVSYKLFPKKDENGNVVLKSNGDIKYIKIPYNPYLKIVAKPNFPKMSSYFTTTIQSIENKEYDGIGLILGNDLCGIDLDDVLLPNSKNKNMVEKIVKDFNSYTEISPSGSGIHILFKVKNQNKLHSIRAVVNDNSFECYNDLRFFTLTGDIYPNSNKEINVLDEDTVILLLEKYFLRKLDEKKEKTIIQSDLSSFSQIGSQGLTDIQIIELLKKETKYTDLFNGYYDKYFQTQNQADMSLVIKIAKYSDSVRQIYSIFEKSNLVRPKWYEKRNNTTYGMQVINQALIYLKQKNKDKKILSFNGKVKNKGE